MGERKRSSRFTAEIQRTVGTKQHAIVHAFPLDVKVTMITSNYEDNKKAVVVSYYSFQPFNEHKVPGRVEYFLYSLHLWLSMKLTMYQPNSRVCAYAGWIRGMKYLDDSECCHYLRFLHSFTDILCSIFETASKVPQLTAITASITSRLSKTMGSRRDSMSFSVQFFEL